MAGKAILATLNKDKTLDAQALLARVIAGGRAVVTASLKARSIAVLKMVAEIDPSTPVVFCHASELFPESQAYRDAVVKQLGLTNVRVLSGEAASTGLWQHCEHLWSADPVGGGRVHEIVHLNELLSDYVAWISAVYHMPSQGKNRVDATESLIKVDPVKDWSDEKVRNFLREAGLPLHPLAKKAARPAPTPVQEEPLQVHCY